MENSIHKTSSNLHTNANINDKTCIPHRTFLFIMNWCWFKTGVETSKMMMPDQNNQTFLSHIQAIINLAIYAICYQNYWFIRLSKSWCCQAVVYFIIFFENRKHFHFMNVSAVLWIWVVRINPLLENVTEKIVTLFI